MRGLIAAVSFLTRLPVGRQEFDAKEVARSAKWFPLVGFILGGIYAGVLWGCTLAFPVLVTATILAGVDAALTGAMHLDGLADTADGFGGRTRNDALRIMHDHNLGAYGAVVLVLVLLLRIAAVAAVMELHRATAAVWLAPVLGRWSAVLSGATQRYARASEKESPATGMHRSEVLVATSSVAVASAAFMSSNVDFIRPPIAWALVAGTSMWWARRCDRRLGGITGDTLGAGIEMSECLVFLVYAAGH